MKKLLIVLLTLGSLSAFAGTIKNGDTGESINLKYDSAQKIIQVSTTGDNEKMIPFGSISSEEHPIKYYPVTMAYCDYTIGDIHLGDSQYYSDRRRLVSCALIPVVNAGTIPLAIGETIILPIKLVGKMIKDQRSKKDFDILTKAILQEEVIRVSAKRFGRISAILWN